MYEFAGKLKQETTLPHYSGRQRSDLRYFGVTFFAMVLLLLFLLPLLYGMLTAVQTDTQIAYADAPVLWPALPRQYAYEGTEYDVYKVPIANEDGKEEYHNWALVIKKREESFFMDPENPEAGLIQWQGRWRQLDPVWEFGAHWENFAIAWERIEFPKLLKNTFMYAFISTIGAVSSATLVAYGFARFRFPGRRVLFIVVLSTIILPPAVTLIPTYYFFNIIGWVGSYKPLIVPAFFSNAYNVLLLRQFFLTIPRELDEAATIDGAGPFQIFLRIILPNAKAPLIAVSMYHFFFAWNDLFLPLIYLAGKTDLEPISIGLTHFNQLYGAEITMIQAGSLISLVIPIVVFFLAQRYFMQGVVITGVER